MFLFVIAYVGPVAETPWAGGPRWQVVAAVLAAAAIFLEIVVVVGLKASAASRTPARRTRRSARPI